MAVVESNRYGKIKSLLKMPIEFFKTDDELIHIKQSFNSPTIYLDHWAIRLFSDNKALQNRFVNTFQSKNGTLLLSHFTFSEFASNLNPEHCEAAESFIERLLPNIYLTDFAFDKIHNQELTESDNSKRFWPSADLPQLKLFAERAQNAPLGFTMRGFIMMAHDNRGKISSITNSTVTMIKEALEQSRKDAIYVEQARKSLPSNSRTRTFIILGELSRGFILDNNAPIAENDIVDMMHAAMTINCCDYVLLDGPWLERVEKMRARINKTGIDMPIAKCFSKRNGGIDNFLNDLENF